MFHVRSAFNYPRVLVRLLLPEAVYVIIGHTLLCNNNFLRAIYYKVAPLIIYAFSKLTELFIRLISKNAKPTA
jgi:hypothetical protein